METAEKKVDLYQKLGVDSGKEGVVNAFRNIINNIYPGAFVNIIEAPYTNGNIVMTQHQDGDGSKMIQRLLHYRKFGDPTILGFALDDAMSMNCSDVAAAGFVNEPWIITQVINSALPGEKLEDLKNVLMQALKNRWVELADLYAKEGFSISFLGGETADLIDQVRSAVLDMTITAYARREQVIKGNVQPGDKIWGFASDGQAAWEDQPNSGIMSNGLTLARSCLMDRTYNHIYHDLKRSELFYTGRFMVEDKFEVIPGLTVSEAIISPTRQWPIVIKKIINRLIDFGAFESLHGISINTGGGATKISRVGKGIIYIKTMPEPAPLFKLIQAESGQDWQYMFKTFNCGVGIDIIGKNDPYMQMVLEDVATECGITLYELGSCKRNTSPEKNEVLLATPYGNFNY